MMSSQRMIQALAVIWIHTSIVPVSMTVSSPSDITSPDRCSTYIGTDEMMVVVRCHEFDNTWYFKQCIDQLIIENVDHTISLGPHEFVKRGLSNLSSIVMSNIENLKIDREAFDGMLQLDSISFVYNKKLDIHQDAFQNNTKLSRVEFIGNQNFMDHCDTMNDYLFDAPSINVFSLQQSDYKCWSASSFSKMENITDLTMDNMEIIPGIFAPLQKLLNFSLPNGNFNILKNVNEMSDLDTLELLYGTLTLDKIQITGLKSLLIQWTHINNIGKYDLMGMPSLERLELGSTKLKTIHEDAFSHLAQLEYLRIGGSDITSFTEYHVRNNFRLKSLKLDYNNGLGHLPLFRVNATLNSTYNIYEFSCTNCYLNYLTLGTFDDMPLLKTLTLNRNRLESIPRGFFKQLSSLESLDLSDNSLSNIPDELFEGAVKLSDLNLRNNDFTTLQLSPFFQTPELSLIDLLYGVIWLQREENPPRYTVSFWTDRYGEEIAHITVNQSNAIPNLLKLNKLLYPSIFVDKFIENMEWVISTNITFAYKDPPLSRCNEQVQNISCWRQAYAAKYAVPLPITDQNSRGPENGDYARQYFFKIYEWFKIFVYLIALLLFITIVANFVYSVHTNKILSDAHSDREYLQETSLLSEISEDRNNYSNNICHVFHIDLPENKSGDCTKTSSNS